MQHKTNIIVSIPLKAHNESKFQYGEALLQSL